MKSFGYLLSLVSVFLLGLVSWQSTADQPLMRWALIGGVAASVVGLLLRLIANLRKGDT